MPLGTVWNEANIKAFAEEYAASTSGQMARKYGVHPQTIIQQLKRLGIPRKGPGRPHKIGNALPEHKEAPQTGTTEG